MRRRMDHGEIARSLCSSSVVTPTHFSLAHLFMQSWQRALAKMENVYSSVYCRRFMNNNEYRTTTLYILHLYIYISYTESFPNQEMLISLSGTVAFPWHHENHCRFDFAWRDPIQQQLAM